MGGAARQAYVGVCAYVSLGVAVCFGVTAAVVEVDVVCAGGCEWCGKVVCVMILVR
jgi:hypothetical protein